MAKDEDNAKEKTRELAFNKIQWDDTYDYDILPLDAEEIEES